MTALSQETWNMDFVSITDHSNSFDDAGGSKRLADAPTGRVDLIFERTVHIRLAKGVVDDRALGGRGEDNLHRTIAQVSDANFVGLFGYEMTWSNGLGHINTFNTPGYQCSRSPGSGP